MRSTLRSRRVAAILAVLFLLTTVWAVYYLESEMNATSGGGSHVLATYTQEDANNFTASLQRSVLYNNSTEVYGGNITLFSPITNWINATLVYGFSANRTVSVSLEEVFAVVLSTPAWSKLLYSSVNTSKQGSSATLSLALTTRYSINVSALEGLVTAIDDQIGYTAYTFTLSLTPTFFGTVETSGVRESLEFEPQLNFTFATPLIKPSGLSLSSEGSVLSVPHAAKDGTVAPLPVLAVVGSVGGVGGSLWFATRRPEDETVPLPELISPYEETIAETDAWPTSATVVRVGRFEDLAKIADALGKPILRAKVDPSVPPEFRVIDGAIAYSYLYPELVAVPPAVSEGPSAPPASSPPSPSPPSAAPMDLLKVEVIRLRALPPNPALLAEAQNRVHRTIDLLRAGKEREAMREIDDLSALISRASAASRRTGDAPRSRG